MVRITNHQRNNNNICRCLLQRCRIVPQNRLLFIVVGIGIVIAFTFLLNVLIAFTQQERHARADTTTSELRLRGAPVKNNNDIVKQNTVTAHNGRRNEKSEVDTIVEDSDSKSKGSNDELNTYPLCPYMKLSDLTDEERYPKKSTVRHMVSPPIDGNVTLVCCHTTAGPWNIMVHTNWAPIGSQRFLDMVSTKFFDTTVPLMRCIKNFICQFGLNGHPTAMKPYIGKHTLKDDPNWLPEGPNHRMDPETHTKRFNRGYLAYAGAGPHSRDIQFIVALQDNGPLGGGSPWEVPWGELVGNHSYDTLSKIYTGYDEKGPSQGLLHKADALTVVKERYPLLDYIQSCYITDSA